MISIGNIVSSLARFSLGLLQILANFSRKENLCLDKTSCSVTNWSLSIAFRSSLLIELKYLKLSLLSNEDLLLWLNETLSFFLKYEFLLFIFTCLLSTDLERVWPIIMSCEWASLSTSVEHKSRWERTCTDWKKWVIY